MATDAAADREIVSAFEIYPRAHQEAELLETEARLVFSIGGLGSGKTAVDGLIVLDRAGFDTSQRGAIFANTARQLNGAILPEVCKWLDRANVQWTVGKQPPPSWIRLWKKLGIQTPPPSPAYQGVLILDSGLHVTTGSLHDDNYRQFRSFEFGWAIVEEVTSGMKVEALNYIIQRVRCGLGEIGCKAAGHRHQVYIKGNPPETPDHWLFDYIERLDRKSYRLIQSSSYDNIEATGAEYVEGLLATMDAETAKALIGGELIRNRAGRVYYGFTDENRHSIPYDPARTLYLSLDFNVDPAIAVLAHPLNPGEYPGEHEREGLKHIGFFGEFFHAGGMDSYQLAVNLAHGTEGVGGNFPENWKGLKEHQERVVVYGDATGRARNMASAGLESNWKIVNRVFAEALGRRFVPDVPKSNPPVHLSVRALNAKLENAKGVRSVWVDPDHCPELIKDFLSVAWSPDGSDIVKHTRNSSSGDERWKRSHESDAARYFISARFPAVTTQRVPFASLESMGPQPGTLSSQLPSLGRGPWRGL